MPNYFRLVRKSDPEAGPVVLNLVDEEICELVGEEVHASRYCLGWFDSIGYRLATGRSWDEVRARLRESRDDPKEAGDEVWKYVFDSLLRVADWLEANFDVEWGYQSSSRRG